MVIINKNYLDTLSIENGPVQRVTVEESTRRKWASNMFVVRRIVCYSSCLVGQAILKNSLFAVLLPINFRMGS